MRTIPTAAPAPLARDLRALIFDVTDRDDVREVTERAALGYGYASNAITGSAAERVRQVVTHYGPDTMRRVLSTAEDAFIGARYGVPVQFFTVPVHGRNYVVVTADAADDGEPVDWDRHEEWVCDWEDWACAPVILSERPDLVRWLGTESALPVYARPWVDVRVRYMEEVCAHDGPSGGVPVSGDLMTLARAWARLVHGDDAAPRDLFG